MATEQIKQFMEQLKEIQAAIVSFQASMAKPSEVRIEPRETSQTGQPAEDRMKPDRVRPYECRDCGKKGPWTRECPSGAASLASTSELRRNESQAKVVISSRKTKTAVYLSFEYEGKNIRPC